MPYKVIDIFKDLPRTNCGDCGRPSCFAFASAVYLEAFPLDGCPHVNPDRLAEMQARLDEGREQGEGRRPASSEQALRALLEAMRDADLAARAGCGGGTYVEEPEDGVRLLFLGEPYVATRHDVASLEGRPVSHWIKIFILIYLTRASGRPETGEWVAYRSLPNTVSKAKSFEESVARIAAEFEGDLARLVGAVADIGGTSVEPGSADAAFRIQVLPRVSVLLLVWDRQEEFPARASLLLDRVVLEYLDQEALVFMAEALVARVLGEDVTQIVG